MTYGHETLAEAVAALERFVVDNDDLMSLEMSIGRFNIFDALGIARAEIRHSNFLAFLLDPAESHGQSQLFLRGLLMDLLKAAPPSLRPLSPIDVDGIELRDVEVRREWNRIDLFIACRQPSFVVAIENKMESTEHSGQLARYKKVVNQHYPGARPLFVFLTPDGSEPSEQEWIPYTYTDLHRVFSRVRRTHAHTIGDDVRVFVDHYLTLIGTRFMNDPTIDELCQRIYKNHRQALQLIYERVGSPGSGVIASVESAIRADERWQVFYRSGNLVDFVPAAWLAWLPPIGTGNKQYPQSWFVLRFDVHEGHLDFYAQVNRMNDAELRRAIIDKLLAVGSQYGLERKQKGELKIKDSFTRVASRAKVHTWSPETTPDEEAIQTAVARKLDQLHPKLGGLPVVMQAVLATAEAKTL